MSSPSRVKPHQLEPGADGQVLVTVGDTVEWGDEGTAGTEIVLLTTDIDGVPELIWDGNNELVYTEVPA